MRIDTYFDSLLNVIFEKGWNSQGIVPNMFIQKAMALGKEFSDEEREFFMTMLKDFDIYPEPMYQFYLEKVLKKIKTKRKNIYVAPLLSKVDMGNPYKSSVFVTRMFESTYIKQLHVFDGKYLRIYDTNCILQDYLLLLVDDFIGTGTTAHSCISYYESIGISKENMLVLSFVIMNEGLKKLKKEKVNVEYYEKYDKCISHRFKEKDAQKWQDVNSEVCARYKIEKPLGFHNSQALVSMQRTPNNTLPIFWSNKIKYPLFPR